MVPFLQKLLISSVSERFTKALFAILRESLHKPEAEGSGYTEDELSLFETYSDKDWETLLSTMGHHGLLPLSAESMMRLPQTHRPPAALKIHWMLLAENAERQYRKMGIVQQRVESLCKANGFTARFIKGPEVAAYYPIPQRRSSCDIDVYTGPSFDAFNTLLCQEGAVVTEQDRKVTQFRWQGTCIENHKTLLEVFGRKHNGVTEQQLHILMEDHSERGRVLFKALLLLQHAHTHFCYEGFTLRHLCDWAAFLQQEYPNLDLDALEVQKKQGRFGAFANGLTQIAVTCLGLKLPNSVIAYFPKNQAVEDRMVSDTLQGATIGISHLKGTWKTRKKQLSVLRQNAWKFRMEGGSAWAELFSVAWAGLRCRFVSKKVASCCLTAAVAVMACLLSTGCAALTTSQIQTVNSLAVRADSVASAPSALFDLLATVRQERGVFYAASLTSVEAHLAELDALSAGAREDRRWAQRTDVCVQVLESYLRSLRSLSHTSRWSGLGTEVRVIGNQLDSAIIKYNLMDWGPELPEGVSKLSGKVVAYFAQNYMRNRQAVAVREWVNTGDTLVSVCCDALIDLLRKQEVKELLDNEQEGLRNNYRAYLQQMGPGADVRVADRKYLELSEQLQQAVAVRDKCVSALRSLKKAHHKLPAELKKRKRMEYFYEELLEMNTLANQLKENL